VSEPHGPKVLLLDDEQAVLETTSAVLEIEGYDVITSSTGADALEKVSKIPSLAIALLDIRMEPINGVDVLADLRKIRPDLPVLVVTAYSSDDLEKKAYHLEHFFFTLT
jgi:CheY-like chemotaxis protein